MGISLALAVAIGAAIGAAMHNVSLQPIPKSSRAGCCKRKGRIVRDISNAFGRIRFCHCF